MVARATKRKTRPDPEPSSSASTGGRKRRKTRVLTDDEDEELALDVRVEGDLEVVVRPHAAPTHILSADQRDVIRTALLEWYASAQDVRAMPWRKRWDETLTTAARAERAYEVWISEIMLQQTQVATVIPYYTRWMERFPTVQALSEATIDDVNALWKGLGYYSRAARLLAGAQKVVKDFRGHIPSDPVVLEKSIPGIGRYSAGAITSIAYGVCAPVLDGNVHRLLSRVLALHAPPQAKTTLTLLWSAAAELVKDAIIPGDVNQALIELGSTVCKPRAPACAECPIRASCGAFKLNLSQSPARSLSSEEESQDIEDLCEICTPLPVRGGVMRFPQAKVRKKAREETDIACVVYCGNYVLLRRRPEKGLLGGLYEFPTAPAGTEACDVIAACVAQPVCKKALGEGEDECGDEGSPKRDGGDGVVLIERERPAGDIVHIFSHIRQTWQVVIVDLALSDPAPALAAAADSVPLLPQTKGECTWVRETDVAGQNLGTGTLKQWHLASKTVGGRTRKISRPVSVAVAVEDE